MSSLLHFLESHSCLSVLLPCVFSCIANLISFAFPCNEFLVCVIPFVLKRVPCMFPHVFLPALHRFATIILFPVCSPVRYTDRYRLSLFWSYVTQRYSHRREGLPRSVGVGLREVGEINLDFIINKSCLPVPSFFRCFFFRRRLCNLPVKATFCIAE